MKTLATILAGTALAFDQNWNLPFPRPLEHLKGVHDVNSVPFGTLSYCDWLQGNFPVPR